MHIHILGICGTFMAGIALLAKQQGHRVTGSDVGCYAPMDAQLAAQSIPITQGYSPDSLKPFPDCVIIGNALSRGNPAVEFILDQDIPYTSGPQWLADHILPNRWVLAVSGTHGKTTTSSLLAWILEAAGLTPGFLIGGIPENFGISARLGEAPFFVVEADEYDTAFFDKRSKFLHYHPRTLILNNLEFDHADIFPDLKAIQRQFHHLIRTVPSTGLLIRPQPEPSLDEVLQQGCWTPLTHFEQKPADNTTPSSTDPIWQAKLLTPDASHFEIWFQSQKQGEVHWSLFGQHNAQNALAALLAARHAGVSIPQACLALSEFKNVKRRLELRGTVKGIHIYDDFAHHPTAIAVTLQSLRNRIGPHHRLIAVLEPRSNTMRMGIHQTNLAQAFQPADQVLFYQPPHLNWSLHTVANTLPNAQVFENIEDLLTHLTNTSLAGDHILIMSNGHFYNLHQRLLQALG